MEVQQREEILKIIKLYRQYECLWNIKSKYFRRTDVKNKAYAKIASLMNKDEAYIIKKIKNLRTAYTAEKKKIDHSLKDGIEYKREPSLFYFRKMTFLDPNIRARTYNGSLLVSLCLIYILFFAKISFSVYSFWL